jgi:PAS domain-containing protein
MIKIIHDELPDECPGENCCVCFEPTHLWYIRKDVPLCCKCARKIKAKDIPTKDQWCEAVAKRETYAIDSVGGSDHALNAPSVPLSFEDALLKQALDAVRSGNISSALNAIPVAAYMIDRHGVLQHFNEECVRFAGRTPQVGRDMWCVTWKLYTVDGEYLPHDQCPMAIAIKERRAMRNLAAIAERPDGTRMHFRPFPTPLMDGNGVLTGAMNIFCPDQPDHQ